MISTFTRDEIFTDDEKSFYATFELPSEPGSNSPWKLRVRFVKGIFTQRTSTHMFNASGVRLLRCLMCVLLLYALSLICVFLICVVVDFGGL